LWWSELRLWLLSILVIFNLSIEGGSSVTEIWWGVGSWLVSYWIWDENLFWSTCEVWLRRSPLGVWPVSSLLLRIRFKLTVESGSSVSKVRWSISSGLVGDWIQNMNSFWGSSKVWLWWSPFSIWPVVTLSLDKSLFNWFSNFNCAASS
jgi:hypothetical protein